MSFTYWCIAQGVPYVPGRYLKYALLMNKKRSNEMLKKWNNGIVWC